MPELEKLGNNNCEALEVLLEMILLEGLDLLENGRTAGKSDSE